MSIPADAARALLHQIRSRRILVIGDVMLDHYIWGDATRISPEAPVPVVEISRDTYVPGGAANVALNCAALGARTSVAGYLGEDDAGRRLKALLHERGIEPIAATGTGMTIIKTRVILQSQQLCRLDRESPPAEYRWAAAQAKVALEAAIHEADAIVLSDYAKGLLSTELVNVVIRTARSAGRLVALDPKPRNAIAFSGVDLLTPNRREAAQLAGVELSPHSRFPAEEICRRIHEKYRVKHLVITMSEDGMLLCDEGHIVKQIPTAAREVYDVSGAGDTSIAALVLALAAGAELETAAHFANAAAGVVVGKIGTATVSPEELLAYVASTP
ncbi:MAG TPA: D-glycero-beta-D-manno-heptose-7-phosphate kinase [Candidatus Synoicihabitans sp.]|nr:D-glycero-beta-D-manno-heptose-7-phosphate kinase [Candidatus Synoicihabitans sp.]